MFDRAERPAFNPARRSWSGPPDVPSTTRSALCWTGYHGYTTDIDSKVWAAYSPTCSISTGTPAMGNCWSR